MSDRWWGGVPAADVVPDAHLLAAVDEALAGSGAAAEVVCTYTDSTAPFPSTGVAVRLSAEPADPAATLVALSRTLGGPVVRSAECTNPGTQLAVAAVQAASAGTAGRCVRFPGQAEVSGKLSTADLVTATAIDELVGVGVAVTPDHLVDTRDFLRPTWSGGRLTLVVEQAAGGVLKPFEVGSPHECCGGAGH